MPQQIIDNRYRVIKEIGEGGFANVYKAWAYNLEKFVAVKKINETFSKEAKFLDMFRTEAVNTAKLDHANIVRVIDFLRTQKNVYYIIMEYVHGKDLRYLLQQCSKRNLRIPFGLSMFIIGEILKALEYAHNLNDERERKPLNIVHRDISPGNIMLYYDGRVKLTDFGIAQVSSKFGEKTEKGVLRGKVAYMSPEQANGSSDIDHRSDIFSLGIVLYEILTGQHLFDGKSDYEIWTAAKKGKINLALIEKAVHVPAPIKAILAKSLQKNPNERYASASEMLQDILKFFGDSYNVQAEGMKDFLLRCMPDEIAEEEASESVPIEKLAPPLPAVHKEEVSLPEQEESHPSVPAVEPHQEPSKAFQERALANSEKTVFDFVLETAKRHERIIIYSLIGIIGASALFFTIDIFKQLTPFGRNIHGYVWPPALTIDSFPTGALTFLIKDNKEIIKGNNTTPVAIDKMIPGNYELTLSKEGYTSIERIINVKGEDLIYAPGKVIIKESKKNYFLFMFEVPLYIQSTPPGAIVHIDGKKLPQPTGVYQQVEIGKHTIQLFLEPFESLGSSNLSPSYGQCWIDLESDITQQKGIDHRYWKFEEREKKGLKEYVLHGVFWRPLNIDSDPTGANVYIDSEKESRGKTPISDVRLKVGKHFVRVSKDGYKTLERSIEIGSDSDGKATFSLEKYIWFRSFASDNPEKDLQASVSIKGTGIKERETPFRVALPLKKYTVRFEKGTKYESQSVTLHVRNQTTVKATLKLRNPLVRVIVTSERDKSSVAKAYILFNDIYQGTTNNKGVWEGYVKPGDYKIKVNTGDKFLESSFKRLYEIGGKYTEEVQVFSHSNCTLYVDTRPYFIGAQIYIDNVYQNETIRKMTKMDIGKHTVLIRHYDLEQDIETTVSFTQPKQTIKIRLNEEGKFLIDSE